MKNNVIKNELKKAIFIMMTMPLCLLAISIAMNGFIINNDMLITYALILAGTVLLYAVQYWFVYVAERVVLPLTVVPLSFWVTVSRIGKATLSVQNAGDYVVLCMLMALITYILLVLEKLRKGVR